MSLLLKVALFMRSEAKKYCLTSTQKLIIYTLAARIGNNEICWISQEGLREECEISRSHLLLCLSKLKKHGILTIIKSRGKNLYQLNLKISKKFVDISCIEQSDVLLTRHDNVLPLRRPMSY